MEGTGNGRETKGEGTKGGERKQGERRKKKGRAPEKSEEGKGTGEKRK